MADSRIGPGGLHTIADGPIHVELLPSIGARFHRLRVFGHDLLRTPDDPAEHLREPFFWGGYTMAPWCNRIEVGPQEVYGQLVDLGPNFPDGSAIHGQVYQVPWQVHSDGTLSVVSGGAGWPWSYEARLRVAIEPSRLSIALELTNLSETAMPAGIGLHPWFRPPLEVRINAQRGLTTNLDPSARLTPVSGPFDLRTLRTMPHDLDATWLPEQDPAVELAWPGLGVMARLTVRSEAEVYIVAASPGALNGVAVEPQTHAPFGLRRLLDGEPGGLHRLNPSETLRLAIEFAFQRA